MLLITKFQPEVDRAESFAELARRIANHEPLPHPLTLDTEGRRLHVRRTLREDHRFRIHNRPEAAERKFDKLASSPVKFFRGTNLLFHRDMVGTDAGLHQVFSIGDVHPENFGVMPNADGVPFFGVNDFDEAEVAPFSWDLKRGATGFFLYSKENGFKKSHRLKVVKTFVRGYVDALTAFARDDREKHYQFLLDNSPKLIRKLLKKAESSRKDFLKDKIDLETASFIPTDEVVPVSGRVEEFQRAVNAYLKSNEIDNHSGRAGHFVVKDVAIKEGSGTASLGLDRYWVLIDGETDDHRDDILLEFKQARRSALWGLAPPVAGDGANQRKSTKRGSTRKRHQSEAERIAESHRVHLAGGDPYYGHAEIGSIYFIVRERSPYKDNVDVDALSESGMRNYAQICGEALAQAHARADIDEAPSDDRAKNRIVSTIDPTVLVEDICRFSVAAAHRVERDYKLYCADHAIGAFRISAVEGD